MKVEFFHNVVCSFCFVQSYRMRKIMEDYPEIELVHRSFPLRYEEDTSQHDFKSYDDEGDILSHWAQANRLEKEVNYNVEGMAQQNFDFPYSRQAEIAIRAGSLAAGRDMTWELFDYFQEALFVRSMNLSDFEIVKSLIAEEGIDLKLWQKYYDDPQIEEAIINDFKRANQIELNLIPALVYEDQIIVKGALRPDTVRKALDKVVGR